MSDYSNILNALNSKSQSKLTPAQEVANYSAFSDLQKQGVYLPDLMKRLDDLESKVRSMDASGPKMDKEVFLVMEAAVKGNTRVKEAARRMADAKSRVLMEVCMRDAGFKEAYDAYRNTVNEEYVKSHEKVEEAGSTSNPLNASRPMA